MKNVIIDSGDILIKKLELEDVYKMREWGYHENPLLIGYNFPNYDNSQLEDWLDYKTGSIFNKYFAVYLDNQLIAYFGMKDINIIFRYSTLGIVMNPDTVGKGYGTRLLKLFLYDYFTKMKMKSMYLEVDLFNTRAIRLYENLGFKVTSKYLGKFVENKIDLYSSYYLESKNHFVIKNNRVYNYRYKMKLTKMEFLEKN